MAANKVSRCGMHAEKLSRLLGMAIGLVGFLFFYAGAWSEVSYRVSDALTFPRQPDPRIQILAVDSVSLAHVSPWPWPRALHARLIRRLSDAGVKFIVYDADFSESASDPSEDDHLVTAVRSAGHVILSRDRERTPFPRLQEAARGMGEKEMQPDRDGVVRRISWKRIAQDGRQYPALGYVAATLDGSDAIRWLPEYTERNVILSYPNVSGRAFPTISAKDVLDETHDLSGLRDRIVFVGLTAGAVQRPEIEIHAAFFDTLVGRHWMRPIPLWLSVLFLIMLGTCAARLAEKKRVIVLCTALVGLFFVMMSVTAIGLRFGRSMDLVWPLAVMLTSSGSVVAVRHWRAHRERERRIWQASRQMSRMTADHFIALSYAELEERSVTILRCDVSRLWKDLADQTLLTRMRSWERLASRWREAIWDERGITPLCVEQTLAGWWNVPYTQPDHAARAARAALRAERFLRAEWEFFDFQIVLDCRQAIFGSIDIGACREERLQADDDDDARLLREFALEAGVCVLMTALFRHDLGTGFITRLIGRVPLGKDGTRTDVYELIGPASEITEGERERIRLYEEALVLHERFDFSGRAEKLLQLLARFPNDQPARKLLTRCETVQSPSDRARA